MLRRLTIVVGLAAGPAFAAERSMSGTEIRATVAGATLEIDAGLGARIPIRLSPDGQVVGEAGGLAFFLGASADRGRWWIDGDRLCHQWSTWFSGAPHCLRLRRDGEILRWQSDSGRSGTAAILVPPPTTVAAVSPPRPSPAPPRPAAIAPAAAVPPSPAPSPQPAPAMALGSLVPPQPAPIRPAARSADAASTLRMVPPQPVPAARPASRDPAPLELSRPAVAHAALLKPPRQRYQVVNVRADDVLNVRAGPSADYDIVGRVPPGSRDVEMTGECVQLWCPVRHQGASGWVNRFYLAAIDAETGDVPSLRAGTFAHRDEPDAPRSCLSAGVRGLLDRIEKKFGPVRVISTCRPGALIAGSNRVSRHASGNAVDFDAGPRRAEIIGWLIENHHDGGTMTYRDMEHIHVDIGPHFVSIAGGMRWASWRDERRNF